MTPSTGRALKALNTSRIPWIVALETLTLLANLTSNWAYRSSKIWLLGTTLITAVPLQVAALPHDERFRPSDGRIWALEYEKLALCVWPGYACIVALVCTSQ